MKSVFKVFRNGLQKTKTSLVRNVQSTFSKNESWSEEDYEKLEATLISCDLGVEVSTRLVEDIRDRYERGRISTSAEILEVAKEDVHRILADKGEAGISFNEAGGPTVIMLVGTNGSGKTTTAGKLAHLLRQDGKSVLMAAADTYRAGGIEQTRIWAEEVGAELVAGTQGADAAAVAYDAVSAAQRRNFEVVIVDTAGRQHTRKGLMEELAKVRRSLDKALPGAPHEVLLTLDASTGSNALHQAREFGRQCAVTGLILTKLDGTGKGGVTVAVSEELGYNVRFVGLGEKLDDLQPFDPELFARALFGYDHESEVQPASAS